MESQDRGLTLIEVIVTLALLGTALGAIAGMVQATFRSMMLTERTLEVQQNVRVAVDRMVEELRWGEAGLADPRGGGLCPGRISGGVAAPLPPAHEPDVSDRCLPAKPPGGLAAAVTLAASPYFSPRFDTAVTFLPDREA